MFCNYYIYTLTKFLCIMIEKISEFRAYLVGCMSDESLDKEIRNSLPPAINALLAVEFVDFCKSKEVNHE